MAKKTTKKKSNIFKKVGSAISGALKSISTKVPAKNQGANALDYSKQTPAQSSTYATNIAKSNASKPAPKTTITVGGKSYTSAGAKDAGISPKATSGSLVNQPSVPAGFYPQKPTSTKSSGGSSSNGTASKSSDPTALYFEQFGSQSEPAYQSSPAITNRDVTSPTPGLPTTNVTGTTDFNAILNGGLAGIYNYDQTTQESTDKDITAIFKDLMKAQPDNAEIYNDALKQSGKEEAQKLVNEKQAQLGAITSKAQADQLSLVGQGRGIPEAIIGGQQAQIAREAAIRALPISAELAAAQGNLEMATENLNTLYKIKSDDAANQYAFKVKVADYAIQFATKSQANKINFLKDAYKEQQDAEQENIAQLNKIALELASKGKSSAFLSKIDPKDSNAVFTAIQMAGTALQDVKAGSGSSLLKYTVENGDEPQKIADKLGMNVYTLMALNEDVNWHNLQIGQKLNTGQKEFNKSTSDSTESQSLLTNTQISKTLAWMKSERFSEEDINRFVNGSNEEQSWMALEAGAL